MQQNSVETSIQAFTRNMGWPENEIRKNTMQEKIIISERDFLILPELC